MNDASPDDSRLAHPDAAPRHSSWDARAPDHTLRHVIIVLVAIAVLLAGVFAVTHFGWRRLLGPLAPAETLPEIQQRIADCTAHGDAPCLEDAWTAYVALRPHDGRAIANLAIAQNHLHHHAQAVTSFERAIGLGEGAYDLFGIYADSLEQVGRVDDAITWSYKALAIVPQLVDVRGALARLLLQRGRGYEALSLLQAFDADAEARGQGLYFEGQRMSIEADLARRPPGLAATPAVASAAGLAARRVTLPAYLGHCFVPVTLGDAASKGFMIDTGASAVALDEATLRDSHAAYRVVRPLVTMRLADGRSVAARGILIDRMIVGGVELRDVAAVVCAHCAPLLGQTALGRFDLQTSRSQGLEFVSLTPR